MARRPHLHHPSSSAFICVYRRIPTPFVNRVVIASNNPGKLRELSALLKPLGIEAIPQSDFAVTEAEEPHHTFLENALAKARHASRDARACRRWPTIRACACRCSAASRECTRLTTPARKARAKSATRATTRSSSSGCARQRTARLSTALRAGAGAPRGRSHADRGRRPRGTARSSSSRAGKTASALRPLFPRGRRGAPYRGADAGRRQEPREPSRAGARRARREAPGRRALDERVLLS